MVDKCPFELFIFCSSVFIMLEVDVYFELFRKPLGRISFHNFCIRLNRFQLHVANKVLTNYFVHSQGIS